MLGREVGCVCLRTEQLYTSSTWFRSSPPPNPPSLPPSLPEVTQPSLQTIRYSPVPSSLLPSLPSFSLRPKGMRERKTDLETERQVFEHRLRDEEERYLLRKEEEDPLKEWVR